MPQSLWIRARWYVLGIVVVALIILAIIWRTPADRMANILRKTVRRQRDVTLNQLDRQREAIEARRDDLDDADEQLAEIDAKIEQVDTATDQMNAAELAAAWKALKL